MITINKSVNDWTCGFEESYSVSEIEITFDQVLINQISLAWDYLNDKGNQSIIISSEVEKVNFKSDCSEFDNNVYTIFIRVCRDRTIIIECRDHCCLMCYSTTILENELKVNLN